MATLKQPDLSIVIPAYREEKRIGTSLDKLAVFLRQDDFIKTKTVEVIVVAADALDKTQEIVLNKANLFEQLVLLKPGPKLGKGRDVKYGMLKANGKMVAFMDADLATPLYHLNQFYQACEQGSDVVISTRNLLTYRKNFTRRCLSYAGNLLFRLIGGLWVEDSQCGFKLFNRKAAKLCFANLSILGWGFDMEVLAIAKSNKLKIKAYRINDWDNMPNSTFDENIFITILNSIKNLWQITKIRFYTIK